MRTTNDELTRWIDVVGDVLVVEECLYSLVLDTALDTGYEDSLHITGYLFLHGLVGLLLSLLSIILRQYELVVLSADHDSVNALRYTFFAVFDGHLAFRVGTQISHLLALLTNLCQFVDEAM